MIQIIIVALVGIAVFLYIIKKIYKIFKEKDSTIICSSCDGCKLKESCSKPQNKDVDKNNSIDRCTDKK